MKVEIIYPPVEKRRFQRRRLLDIVRWPMIGAALICPAVNLAVGGKAWSLVVLMALYMLWSLVLCPDLVEYNRISQFIKLVVCSCLLMGLIDVFLAPGWAMTVVPIVCFGGLAAAGILLFTDLERQKQNMQPLLLMIFIGLAGSAAGLAFWQGENRWALIVLGACAAGLLAVCIVVLGRDFVRELKKRFHTQ